MKWTYLLSLFVPTCHFGGGGGGAPRPSPAPPPVTERQTEVKQAQRDTKLLMRQKKGARASILAGETGGYQPGQIGTKSVLGG